MNLEEILKRQKNEFKEKFLKTLIWEEGKMNAIVIEDKNDNQILDWHSSSIKEILEGAVKEVKNQDYGFETVFNKQYRQGVDDTITHLESIIKKL